MSKGVAKPYFANEQFHSKSDIFEQRPPSPTQDYISSSSDEEESNENQQALTKEQQLQQDSSLQIRKSSKKKRPKKKTKNRKLNEKNDINKKPKKREKKRSNKIKREEKIEDKGKTTTIRTTVTQTTNEKGFKNISPEKKLSVYEKIKKLRYSKTEVSVLLFIITLVVIFSSTISAKATSDGKGGNVDGDPGLATTNGLIVIIALFSLLIVVSSVIIFSQYFKSFKILGNKMDTIESKFNKEENIRINEERDFYRGYKP